MNNYRQIIRHALAVDNGRPAPKRVVRTRFIAKASDAWDIAPDHDVDQDSYSQESFWEESEIEDPCVFFQTPSPN